MKAIFLFPGQSSRYPEMIDRLFEQAPEEARRVFGEASDVLGRDLRAHYSATNPAIFATNSDVQIGVFLANHTHLLAIERASVTASFSLGLSLGEYNHLVHIGAIAFTDALRLVAARGAAYDKGPDGAMVSVFPLPLEDLASIVARVQSVGCVEIANLNSPTQHVLSGDREAVTAAASLAELEYGVSCVLIERRIPMHSTPFRPAALAFRPALEKAPWRTPRLPYLPNVLGHFEPDPTPARITDLLERHVHNAVLFRDSVELLAAAHPEAAFIEVGPKAVLHNLLSRRWLKVRRYCTDVPGGAPLAFESIAAEVNHGY